MKGLAKVLGLVVFVLFLAGVASATMGGIEQPVQLILKAAAPPVIDGDMDPIWQCAQEHIQTLNEGALQDDWFDLFGSWRMLWDETNIYLFFYRMDDVIVDEHANAYEQDGHEFYFDADNSKVAGSFDAINDIQIRINHWYTQDSEITFWYGTAAAWDPAFSPTGIVFANKDLDSGLGWTLEVAVPVANILMEPEAGLQFGFEHQTNDNDGSARDVVGKWWNASGNSWFDAGIWGTCELSAVTTGDGILPVLPVTAAIAIDGEQDDAWKALPIYPCNTWVWDGTVFDETLIDDWKDDRVQFQTAYDADNFYCLTKVFDDVVVDEHANTYERDGVEFYFDGDNSKVVPYDGVDDIQMRLNHGYVTTDDIDGGGIVGNIKSQVNFAVGDQDDGYTIEFSVPLAAIAVDPSLGTVFGFELQTNDNDAAARENMRRWWHHSNESWHDATIFGEAVIAGTDAVAERPGVVREFALGQNYPNPFNPVTTIPYSVKTTGYVKLAVYDLMGKEVANLVDGTQSAGSYDATLNGTSLVSGVYFYKLQTADQTVTRKMTLMK